MKVDYGQQEAQKDQDSFWIAVLLNFVGALPLLLGSGWLCTFIFTDYREHLRIIGIMTGLVAAGVGIAMVAGPWIWRAHRRREGWKPRKKRSRRRRPRT